MFPCGRNSEHVHPQSHKTGDLLRRAFLSQETGPWLSRSHLGLLSVASLGLEGQGNVCEHEARAAGGAETAVYTHVGLLLPFQQNPWKCGELTQPACCHKAPLSPDEHG